MNQEENSFQVILMDITHQLYFGTLHTFPHVEGTLTPVIIHQTMAKSPLQKDFSILDAKLCPILKVALSINNEEDDPYPASIENLGAFWDSKKADTFSSGETYAILASFKDHKVTDDFIETIREGIFGNAPEEVGHGDSEMRDQSK